MESGNRAKGILHKCPPSLPRSSRGGRPSPPGPSTLFLFQGGHLSALTGDPLPGWVGCGCSHLLSHPWGGRWSPCRGFPRAQAFESLRPSSWITCYGGPHASSWLCNHCLSLNCFQFGLFIYLSGAMCFFMALQPQLLSELLPVRLVHLPLQVLSAYVGV